MKTAPLMPLCRRDVLTGAACFSLFAAKAGAASSLYWPGTAEWQSVSAADAGFDAAKLTAATDAILEYNSYSVVVLRGGRIVTERYGNGSSAESRFEVASAGKSIVSVLTGIAIGEGHIRSIDQSAADFIPEWKGTGKAAITIRHLLTMTSGLDFSRLPVRNIAGDQFVTNAAMPLKHAPGTVWAYATPSFHLLYHIIARATGGRFEDFATRVLTAPLGAPEWRWLTSTGQGVNGPVTNYYSAICTARELARFGLFALRGGCWQDKRLIDAEYFRQSILPSQTMQPAYGYLWWQNARPGPDIFGNPPLRPWFGSAPADSFAALGHGGQMVIAVPSHDLVVVRQGPLTGVPPKPAFIIEQILGAML